MILVTGGAGFIGSHFVEDWLACTEEAVVNLDRLSYAGSLDNLAALRGNDRHVFVQGDICDRLLVARLLDEHRPRAIVHFAAETHVDRSIEGPGAFIRSNVQGTFELLEASRHHWATLDAAERAAWRFLHVSTDEVFGALGSGDTPFTEQHRYQPNSPYSASKAASDHLVRAWHETYGLPVLLTHCSNNYGPRQYPEKLIPLLVERALSNQPLPVYGDGLQVRDWLHVKDHCEALRVVLASAIAGQSYNLGGMSEQSNLQMVQAVCALLDELEPRADGRTYRDQIRHVSDRPGHDRRYAMDIAKVSRELGWRPRETLASGLRKTVQAMVSARREKAAA
jgi:dTDP-glucose 4,6-dehydratase